MKLIVGLGNPGKTYHNTRHNVGFIVLDNIAKDLNQKFNLDKNKKCEILETIINNEKVILIKPITYMNNSGESVRLVCDFYKINSSDILVFNDDLDIELGRIKIKQNGSSGGHKGIQSIIDHLHTNEIKRVKIGISKTEKENVIDYVLTKFNKVEQKIIDEEASKGFEILNDFIMLSFDNVMNKYNRK